MKLTLLALAYSISLHAATVTFNNYPNAAGNPSGNVVSSAGVTLARSTNCSDCLFVVGNPAGSPFADYGVTGVSNGMPYLGVAPDGPGSSVIMASPGTLFSLSTIDLNKLVLNDAPLLAVAGPPNATTINAVGTLVSGGTVIATFTLNGGTAFQTFTLPAEWQNLVSVKFSANNDGTAGATATSNAIFAMDNIGFTPGAAFTCSYALGLGGRAFGTGGGGPVNLLVTTTSGCAWNSSGLPSWVHVDTSAPGGSFGNGGSSGNGTGTFDYIVDPNPGAARSATLTIAGIAYTIEQAGASIPGLAVVGTMPHLAAQENWTTMFTLVNKSATLSQARFITFGDPTGGLVLRLNFPQVPTWSGPLLASLIDRTLAGNSSLIINTGGPQAPPVLVGSAQLAATGPVDGFAIFHHIPTQQEAVVPMETRNASSYLLAFDNTGGVVLGVALKNVGPASNVAVVIRDETGVEIGAPGATIGLADNGHYSFGLATQFLVTANKRGTIEFITPAGGRISVLGIRFTPPNNALTTIPVLANVGTNGGSIAHLASGGDGWQTTFVLVNASVTAAPATLSFFADQTGNPLTLPLSFPQLGSGATTVASSVTQTLAAGATLTIVSSGAPQLLTGSAQLSTTGHISGFVIFRHNNQEAVVPLESRNAGGYIVAFDNTGGTATGIAVNAASSGQVNIPVTVRADTGATIATDTITLNANGHYAFTLVTDRYPATADIRGTIEFDAPAGTQISALGIRIPAVAAHTYTTLPALAK